jgi:AraC family transcriptional regulator, regulatory protein of adaptative response / DNA-3-methyladenine glycosylase II
MSDTREPAGLGSATMGSMIEDFDRCYRAVESHDARFDGWFVTAVTSTGIYCRPSCPAVTPKRANVRFLASAAAAHRAGFRACKRCRPDASPGSPEWDVRADVVARAMRLIRDGVVDREGVAGLAGRLGYSTRQIRRQLIAELGAGPLALARAQRAQTARTLIENSGLPMTEVAFAAGFASLRQFNETVRSVYGTTPSELRRRGGRGADGGDTLVVRLAYRVPCDLTGLVEFLSARAVDGLEARDGSAYRRTLRLPWGDGVVTLRPADGHVRCELRLEDLRDLTAAVQRCRRLLDLDADPEAIDRDLADDPLMAPLVAATPGMRAPGAVDPTEMAVRAVLGQQISVAAARTLTATLVAAYGKPLTASGDTVTHLFPSADALADAGLDELGMPEPRKRTIRELARRLATGELPLDPGADREQAKERLATVPGIGPWTTGYLAMRALGDPDAFPTGDVAVRKGLEILSGSRLDVEARAEAWRPWRAYAVRHLWAVAARAGNSPRKDRQPR